MEIFNKLSDKQVDMAIALGYDTEREFYHAMRVAPNLVRAHLGEFPITKLLNMFVSIACPERPDLFDIWFDGVKRWDFAGMPLTSPGPLAIERAEGLPGKIQIEEVHAIRDQGRRGTCVAQATTAAFENLNIREGKDPKIDFSEQFCYWSTKQDDGHPNSDGSWAKVCFPSLAKRGICSEELWKYNPEDTGDPGQGPPPNGAIECAAKHKASFVELQPNNVKDIKEQLAKKRVVSFGVPVFDSWMRNAEVARTGKINMPIPNESPIGGHEMALIGYVDDTKRPGGGDMILRNSWGTKWANESKYGAGNGSIPYRYIEEHCMEALCFTKLIK